MIVVRHHRPPDWPVELVFVAALKGRGYEEAKRAVAEAMEAAAQEHEVRVPACCAQCCG